MKRRAHVLWALAGALAACIGTETENPELTGRLVNVQGFAVPGTRVYAIAADTLERVVVDSAFTDAAGKFRFRDLSEGAYNLEGDYLNGTLVAYISGVRYAPGARDIGTDTLRAPGSVSGRMLHQGAPAPGIFCYLSGTLNSAASDSAGYFRINNVSQGRYILIYYAAPVYKIVLDSSVTVVAGRLTELPPQNLERDTASSVPPFQAPP